MRISASWIKVGEELIIIAKNIDTAVMPNLLIWHYNHVNVVDKVSTKNYFLMIDTMPKLLELASSGK